MPDDCHKPLSLHLPDEMIVVLRYIRGIFGILALLGTSFFGTLFLILPGAPLAFIPQLHWLFRRHADFIVGAWLTFAIGIMRFLNGVTIVTHGDEILSNDKALIIMNHRTRLDWFYFWSTAVTDGFVFDLKIALKRVLARIPGAGWAQQFGSFLFLNRDAKDDLPWISDYLTYLSTFRNRAFKLLVFPEGTDMTPNTKSKSDAFADKNGLPRYDYVLHPRTTGVDAAFNKMIELGSLDAVYDVTIAFEGIIPNNEKALLTGDLPRTVHFFVKRHPAAEIAKIGPTDAWQKIWSSKEQFLRDFYNSGEKSLGGRQEVGLAALSEYLAVLFWCFFLFSCVFFVMPAYWYLVCILAVALFVWSEKTKRMIDGTLIYASARV